jgi:acyl-CoA reductase-like NAD-dependent aldehyde dehydrogenase
VALNKGGPTTTREDFMEADDLVKRLRDRATLWEGMEVTADGRLLLEAADMIEQMADRISVAELADAEAHHAD